MSNKKYPKWIDGYAKAAYQLMRSHDPKTHLPFNGYEFYHYFFDLWIEKLYLAVKKFNSSKINIEEIINFLPPHSSIKFNLSEIIVMLEKSRADIDKAKTVIDFLVKIIESRAVNKKWWRDNLIKKYKDVKRIIKNKKLIKANPDTSRELAKVIAGCITLAHGLYNDYCTDYSYDVYGPYKVPTKKNKLTLFIREFRDLKATAVWPKRKNFPYQSIKVYTIYKNVSSKAYYIGCHMDYKENLVNNLVSFQLEVDDKFINSLDKLRRIKEIIFNNSSRHFSKYKKLEFEQQKRIYLKQLCYQFKGFFEKMGVDWRPTKEMVKRVKNKKLTNLFSNYNLTYKQYCQSGGINYLKRIYEMY